MEVKAQGPRRGSKNYTNAFRTQVVAETRDPTRSLEEVARAHGLNSNPLSKWRRDNALNFADPGTTADDRKVRLLKVLKPGSRFLYRCDFGDIRAIERTSAHSGRPPNNQLTSVDNLRIKPQ